MTDILAAFALIADPFVLLVIVASGLMGLLIGAIPGLTVTMGVALLVPITFYMDPAPAIAAIVTMSAVAMVSGDIPGCLLRIPGTPASAAYTYDAFAMTRDGRGGLALGISIFGSAIGGLFGSVVLIVCAPPLARIALQFSDYEYFWLTCLGLTCAVFVSSGSWLKGMISLLLGLLLATVGLDVVSGYPRFTFGSVDLLSGVALIPAMVGIFALAELFRYASREAATALPAGHRIGSLVKGVWSTLVQYRVGLFRGSLIGTAIGALPGAGADIAAWVTYAVARRFSRTPERFGQGHVEGLVNSGAANNSALSGAWIPALVFGIPGDTITAIAIGVMMLKGLQPGPAVFINSPVLLYAVFITFFIANLLIIPLGLMAARMAGIVLSAPRRLLMPVILGFCIVGAFAITNSVFGIVVMLAMGIVGWLMEENDIPVAPAILGLVLGQMLEQNFMTAMLKSQGDLTAFMARPIAAGLGVVTLAVWLLPLAQLIFRISRPARA